MSASPKIINMDGTPDPEADRLAALEERVQALEIWLGMVPLHPDAPAKPEAPPRRVRKRESALPESDAAKAVAGIFHRKLTTPWSPKEISAFRDLGQLDTADLLTLANYYESERKKGHREDGSSIGVHRHDLGTFLNNYRGEVDRANVWAQRHPAAARRPLAGDTAPVKPQDKEPEGWQEWFDESYPSKAGTRWTNCPDEVRKKFTA